MNCRNCAEVAGGRRSPSTARKGILHTPNGREAPGVPGTAGDTGKGRFDPVVVHTLDRWPRNLRVTLESLKILAQHNIGLVSISESINYSTP